ncbi:flagellar basal body rod modification protein [Xaviernesmea oryzae]|uniref:Basal-body rod modification protein FlgD n=1 Tax=Xaviernesmea oryzae TaxID=464029 RepID=A0A1Q9ART2_9HYPH|nr:flagellar hook assembly protein FlgD [Xaviernesmea oryzae]OLP58163.1 flagellar basal body rod modification protein [Xaviernesmea oryzae]SEL80442.1 flagellar basal-body rod modification protein FlgD [Xaviernesmea oryzae]
MAVDGVTGVTNTNTTNTTTTSQASKDAGAASLNYDSFLKLLVTQLKNQDPTQPMDSAQQMAQLATFSQVEQTIKTNKNLETMIQGNALNQAGAVIGRTVTSADGATSGVVSSVKITSTGITAMLASGQELAISAGVVIK